ncbi:DUF421 domain-containing protein [Bacillus sp. 165]|uniref:DUF421 domain-containing protein n=1 Tax=Bacillus sp. 165 TaxID=1529117 RepID=UPI001ADA5EBA|nr:DUF421 domain-containing protein [Bacillus sp. 165]MBO9129004.1 DUF421 domain-containing protein [Bacillus sp. 165]
MKEYAAIFMELVVGYGFLFMVVKWLGKMQISQVTPFDFISALMLGELVGNAVFDKDVGIWEILFAISVWGLLIHTVGIITQKSRKGRLILEGSPSMLIRKGKIDWKAMSKNHIDIDELRQLLRGKDVFSIREVEYAVLETNGTLSVKRKAKFDSPTLEDLKIYKEDPLFPMTIISDGEVLWENIKQCGLDDNWLYKQLLKQKVNHVKDVCYAEWEEGENLFILRY